ncbi:NAD(P)/FAD-dependent oxidoreductase [Neorhizobium sp. NPDC001467]|uniref:NAD(P)/FAD-dependent oxidoreductase n=1 Tax=Neorhizobium sp. NPDC001467 TaxID=3390595 RepID=UPI003D06D559
MGVEVRTGQRVLDVILDGVTVGTEFIRTGYVVWGAGVTATPAHRSLGLDAAPGGLIPVDRFLRVAGHENVFATGDTADFTGTDGKRPPGLAQVAEQRGVLLGCLLKQQASLAEFVFGSRGNTGVIGRNAAIFDFGKWTLKGRAAWLLWAFVHVFLLINFEKRVLVSVQWLRR